MSIPNKITISHIINVLKCAIFEKKKHKNHGKMGKLSQRKTRGS